LETLECKRTRTCTLARTHTHVHRHICNTRTHTSARTHSSYTLLRTQIHVHIHTHMHTLIEAHTHTCYHHHLEGENGGDVHYNKARSKTCTEPTQSNGLSVQMSSAGRTRRIEQSVAILLDMFHASYGDHVIFDCEWGLCGNRVVKHEKQRHDVY